MLNDQPIMKYQVSQKLERPLLQFITTIGAGISSWGIGVAQSWTSPSLSYLKSINSPIPITNSQATWIASILEIGAICSDSTGPIFSNFIGRKYCLMYLTLIQVISWLLIIFAKNVLMLYIARFLIGFGAHCALSYAIIYIGEIADKTIRGKLLFIVKISVGIGFLFAKVAGAFLSYNLMNITTLCTTLLFFFLFPLIPESPYYLLLKDRKEEALQTMKKLRGSNIEEINLELEEMQIAVRESRENNKLAIRELFVNKRNRKSFYIVMTAMATTYLSGRIAIVAFTQEIFEYSEFTLPPQTSAMIIGCIELAMIVLGGQVIECAGRRRVFLFSSTIAFFSLLIMGLFFFMKFNLEVDVRSINWLPFVCLIFHAIAINLGICTISYILLGEMFALSVKTTAVSVTIVATDVMALLSKIIFDWMNEAVGIYANFWIYSLFSFIGTIIFYAVAPETKGKTLEEIQNILEKK